MDNRSIVYEITKRIPKGKVATYSQIARLAGIPHGARAVGMYMKTNPNAPSVPCHRVVSSEGELCGYSLAGGVQKKMQMLKKEGIVFIGSKVDLTSCLWSP